MIAITTTTIIFKKQMRMTPAKEIEVAHANERGRHACSHGASFFNGHFLTLRDDACSDCILMWLK